MGNMCHVQKRQAVRSPGLAAPKHIKGPDYMDPKLAASISRFAMRFCNESDKDRSSVCSPLSAQTVLALTALGCAGASRDELLHAMEFSNDKNIRSSFTALTSRLKSVEGVTLRIANRVYVTKNGTLKPAIEKDAVKVFDSGLEQLDFREKKTSADTINKWVTEQTAGMIKEVVSPDSLNRKTGLVLINAIYFQGLWEFQFSKEMTKDKTFHVNKTTKIKVPMMCKTDGYFRFNHSREMRAKILRLNYQGGQASLVIVLPDEVDGLGDVMRQLAAGYDLRTEIAGLKMTLLDITIPKFKVETEIDLKQLLPKMGIKSIFDEAKSEIQMLTSNQRLYVSEAKQKAVIEVDEVGTKAAACTYVQMRYCSANWSPPQKRIFIADRPFLYILMTQHIPLFVGIYQGSEFAVPDTSSLEKLGNNMLRTE